MEKVTIVLTNYNQEEYIKEAVESILSQDYNRIELIIADDCSKKFDIDMLRGLLKNSVNIEKIKFIVNSKNIGIIKTLNKAIKTAEGEYILFFAADDKLANNFVISNFVKEFNNNKNKKVITAQWKICDENLKFMYNFVDEKKAKFYNASDIKRLYKRMCKSNIFGSGSTCYRKEVFEKYGLMDEKYILVEDWSYWLYLLRKGEKIYYSNFDALLHRKGGLSRNNYNKNNLPKHVIVFYQDILNIFRYEIISNLNVFGINTIISILKSYKFHIDNYRLIGVDVDEHQLLLNQTIKSNSIIKLFWRLDIINPKIITKIKILLKFNVVTPITVVICILLNIIFTNRIELSKNTLLIVYLVSYLIIYYFTITLIKVIKAVRGMN